MENQESRTRRPRITVFGLGVRTNHGQDVLVRILRRKDSTRTQVKTSGTQTTRTDGDD